MILEVAADHLFVVSDLHLGNRGVSSQRALLDFLDHLPGTGAGLVINGDGFDLQMGAIPRLLADSTPVIRRLTDLVAGGTSVRYVLGNHDILLEHLLHDLPMPVAPFLNVTSGGRRIRIEHGHVNEPFYARFPYLYELSSRALKVVASPDTYRLQALIRRRLEARRTGTGTFPHHRSAEVLFDRGFDVVVNGHTHLPERTELARGLYVNGGDWLTHRTVVEIHDGEVRMREWPGR